MYNDINNILYSSNLQYNSYLSDIILIIHLNSIY